MKLKRLPDDFQVEELTTRPVLSAGPFALYRLAKRGVGTLEAVETIARRLRVERRRVSYGGLKDRHAFTTQFLAIFNGPRRGCRQGPIELDYLGQTDRPFSPADISANRFAIVLRSLSPEERARAAGGLEEVAVGGAPNYFDDQRFGSLGPGGEFIAAAWIKGDYQRALWLALAEARPGEPAEERGQKEILRGLWGRWTECKAALARSSTRSVVTYLCDHPHDFRRAFALIRADLRGLYLAAFQSHAWNQMLSAWLRRRLGPERLARVAVKTGEMLFPRDWPPDALAAARGAALPLPSARLKLDQEPERELIVACLAELGLQAREMRVKYPRDSFFARGQRACLVFPAGLAHAFEADDLHPGREKLTLRFELPRGAYATVLVKRVTEESAAAGEG